MEYITIKEKKQEWQKVCFTMANLFTLFSLYPQLMVNNLFAILVLVMVISVFIYFIFIKDIG